MGAAESAFPFTIEDEVTSWAHSHWKLYDGVEKSTSEKCSIFVFTLQGQSEEAIAAAKNCLLRLKTLKYPSVIRYKESAELPDKLYVATEWIQPLNLSGCDEGERILGLFHVIKSLSFLHTDAKLLHGCICPQSLFVTKAGDWKLGGFDLTSSSISTLFQANLGLIPSRYQAPEIQKKDFNRLNEGPIWAADSWALGCLIYETFNGPLQRAQNLTRPGNIPQPLLTYYRGLLNTNVKQRLSPRKLGELPLFVNNPLVESMTFLSTLALKSNQEKKSFFINFATHVNSFPDNICKYGILPQLLDSLTYGAGLACFAAILSAVLKIGKKLNEEEYALHITPSVIRLFTSNERAVRVCIL